MVIKSYCKINLSLQITGKRDNGYHTLDMVELPIDLHDVIEITYEPASTVTHITCDEIRLAKFKDNLCKRAYDALKETYKFKQYCNIFIHKVVPFAAGLGGGSSNAASVLKGLNSMFKIGATEEELCKIGLQLGADVPFFFERKPSRVSGIGEIVEPIKVNRKDFYVVLIKPEMGCSTKEIYSICDNFEKKEINNDLVLKGLETGDEDLIAANLGNDLMAAAMSLNPQIQPTLDVLKGFGFKIVSMSGSGSSCFALSTNQKLCQEAYKKLEKLGYNVYLSKVLK